MEYRMIPLDAHDMLNKNAGFSTKDFQKIAGEKGAKPMETENLNRLLDTEFGIVFILPNGDRLRKFPIANKAALKMSIKAFKKNKEKIPEEARRIIAHRLQRAAERYDIETDDFIKKIVANTYSTGLTYPLTGEMMNLLYDAGPDEDDVKTASAYGITKNLYGEKMLKFPLNDKKQWHRQNSFFEKKAYIWYSTYSTQMASNLIKRASELGINYKNKPLLCKLASNKLSENAFANIDARIKAAELRGKTNVSLEYADLRTKVASVSPRQLAISLEDLDRKHNMHYYWSTKVGSKGLFNHPVDAILDGNIKQASIIDIGGVEVDIEKLTDLLKNHKIMFEQHLDPETVKELIQNPEGTLKNLPPAQREIVITILKESM